MLELDDAVQVWLSILRSDERDEDDIPLYSLADKERVFKAITTWLKDRKRLFPDDAPREGRQVTEMRSLLRDPEIKREIRNILGGTNADGGPRAPRPARDTDAEQKKSAAGSALHALVFDADGIEEAQT